MRRLIDTLHGRLALVLLTALLAGFGTMYALFQYHSDDTRLRIAARSIAVQIQMVEQLLRATPALDGEPVKGVRVSPLPEGTASAESAALVQRFQARVEGELGRPVRMQATNWSQGGLWVALNDLPRGERWMFFPVPKKRAAYAEPWVWGLWVSFVVILIGGLALLWGVQKPLRRLEDAIRGIRTVAAPTVDVQGPREVRNVAEQFNRMIGRLRQYDDDRAVMLAGVAHDLRAPLTRLRLQLELENPRRRDEMCRNLDGMEEILDQFLAFARGGEFETAVVANLPMLVQEIAAAYRGRELVLDIADDDTMAAEIRPASLRRCLCNLLDNAFEYGAENGAAAVGIALRREGYRAVIEVSDTGPGIAAERIPDALRPFTRLDASRGGRGHCGLGLAIAAQFAAAHGGELRLRGATPHGLVAELRLPLNTTDEIPTT